MGKNFEPVPICLQCVSGGGFFRELCLLSEGFGLVGLVAAPPVFPAKRFALFSSDPLPNTAGGASSHLMNPSGLE
jgi:hypothetical protein